MYWVYLHMVADTTEGGKKWSCWTCILCCPNWEIHLILAIYNCYQKHLCGRFAFFVPDSAKIWGSKFWFLSFSCLKQLQ